jgi:hypothetical protein
MPEKILQDPTAIKVGAGLLGAVVSLKWVKGDFFEKLLMVIGGAALSIFGTDPLAEYLNMTNALGILGFLLGLFGMTVMSRVYEGIQAFNAADFVQSWASRFGGKKGEE